MNRVEVTALPLAAIGPKAWAELYDQLDAPERQRADQFGHDDDRHLFIAAHGLLRRLLSAKLAHAPRDLRFALGAHGKPYLAEPQARFDFNISHTRGLVAVALGEPGPVGIDVEPIDRVVERDVAGRFFAADEIAWLEAHEASQRPLAFLRLWTLKEAFLKATGKGLTRPLSSFCLSFAPLSLMGEAGEAWDLAEARPTRDHLLAVCAPKPAQINVTILNLVN